MTIDFPHYNKIYPLPFLIFFYLEKNKRNKEYFFEHREVINMVGMIESNIARKAL